MTTIVRCPVCKEPMIFKTTYQRAGAIIGGGVGGVAGAIAGYKTGAKVGGWAGGIVGAVTGFVAGGTLGSKAGKLIDENYIVKCRCPECGKEINL